MRGGVDWLVERGRAWEHRGRRSHGGQSPPRGRLRSRRAVLAAVGSGLAAGLAGCNAYPPERRPQLEVQLEDVREATATYDHPLDAMADGFQALGPYVPGRGWPFRHPGRAAEAAERGFDRERPTRLLYVRTEAGFDLAAAGWAAPVESVPEDPDLFDDTDGSEEWRVQPGRTHVFAFPDGEQTDVAVVGFSELVRNDNWAAFRPPNFDLEAGETIALRWGSLDAKTGDGTERVSDQVTSYPDLNALYAWVHLENPEGVFNPTNPRVK